VFPLLGIILRGFACPLLRNGRINGRSKDAVKGDGELRLAEENETAYLLLLIESEIAALLF